MPVTSKFESSDTLLKAVSRMYSIVQPRDSPTAPASQLLERVPKFQNKT